MLGIKSREIQHLIFLDPAILYQYNIIVFITCIKPSDGNILPIKVKMSLAPRMPVFCPSVFLLNCGVMKGKFRIVRDVVWLLGFCFG